MMRTDDGSIRGTIKMIESLKLRNLQQQQLQQRPHRGDGAVLASLTLHVRDDVVKAVTIHTSVITEFIMK